MRRFVTFMGNGGRPKRAGDTRACPAPGRQRGWGDDETRRDPSRARSQRRPVVPMTAGIFFENFMQALAAGLLVGAIYGLMCLGLGLIFGVMRVINFAQGDFLMLGMYFTLYAVSGFGTLAFLGPIMAPYVGALLAGPVLFLGGWLLHRLLMSRITGTRAAGSEGDGHYSQ